jgi:hypothetical protein
MKNYIYMAAGLFNVETNMVNAYFTKQLEAFYAKNPLTKRGEEIQAKCYLPQRDGFEVGKIADFISHAGHILPPDGKLTAAEVVMYVPYYLDLGYFMSNSIAVVANLDEPIDNGLMVEIAYAKLCNIPVIGLRTDLRTPLGERTNILSINPFIIEQCDCFIWSQTPPGDFDDVMSHTDSIITELEKRIRKWVADDSKSNEMRESQNPIFKNIIKGSDLLFSDLEGNIHTDENMTKIVKSFAKHAEFLMEIAPELVPIGTPGE